MVESELGLIPQEWEVKKLRRSFTLTYDRQRKPYWQSKWLDLTMER